MEAPRNKKALVRRWVSILQGTRGPDWLKYGHYEPSASSLPPEGLHLVWKEEGSKDNRAFWWISGTQKRVLTSEPRRTAKMGCRRQVCPYLKCSLLTSASWGWPLGDKNKEALLTQSLLRGGWGAHGNGHGTASEKQVRLWFLQLLGYQWPTYDWPPLTPVGEPSLSVQLVKHYFKNVNIQCWEGMRRWVCNTGKNINLPGKQFETTHQKSQKWPCPYRFILKK